MTELKIAQSYLRELFIYDNGYLYWRVKKGARINVGDIAGSVSGDDGDEYLLAEIDEVTYKVHRLVWIYHFGEIAKGVRIDHIDNNGLNNVLSNLRLSTPSQNGQNARKREGTLSKYKGVSWHKGQQRWNAVIQYNRKRIHISSHKDEYEAHLAYCKVGRELFGEFFNDGGPYG